MWLDAQVAMGEGEGVNAQCAGVQVDVYTPEPQGALGQGVEGPSLSCFWL